MGNSKGQRGVMLFSTWAPKVEAHIKNGGGDVHNPALLHRLRILWKRGETPKGAAALVLAEQADDE